MVPFAQASNAFKEDELGDNARSRVSEALQSRRLSQQEQAELLPQEGRPVRIHSAQQSTFRGHALHLPQDGLQLGIPKENKTLG